MKSFTSEKATKQLFTYHFSWYYFSLFWDTSVKVLFVLAISNLLVVDFVILILLLENMCEMLTTFST